MQNYDVAEVASIINLDFNRIKLSSKENMYNS
jgi:hypothetical protein